MKANNQLDVRSITMITIDSKIWRKARRALERAVLLHLDDPNVSHIDLGFRTLSSAGHRLVEELAVRIHVRRKLYGEAFEKFAARHPHWVIDAQRLGFATDVPQAGYELARREGDAKLEHVSQPHRHAHQHNAAVSEINGIIGGRVRDRRSGAEMILSTWHDLTDMPAAAIAAPYCLPSRGEGDGWLGANAAYVRAAMEANLDAAVARISPASKSKQGSGAGAGLFHGVRQEVATVHGPIIPQLGMRVMKVRDGVEVGAGIITGILGCGFHRYAGRPHLIRHVVHIAPEEPDSEIRALKDSGAWWVAVRADGTRRAVGVHFAGGKNPQFALTLSMPAVLEALDVEIIVPSRSNCAAERDEDGSAVEEVSGDTLGSAPEEHAAAPFPEVIKGEAMTMFERSMQMMQKLFDAGKISTLYESIWRGTMAAIKGVHFKVAQTILLATLFFAVIGFCHLRMTVHGQEQEQAENARLAMECLRAAAKVDSVHRQGIRKIVVIIARYNPQMAEPIKFSIAEEIYRMSRKYSNLDLELICATITHESGRSWNARAISAVGALGLMQIMPATGRELVIEEGVAWTSAEEILFDPVLNIRLGCRYLSELVGAYNIDGGLAAYNGGERRAERWVRNGRAGGILHEETAYYVPSILKIYEQYRKMSI